MVRWFIFFVLLFIWAPSSNRALKLLPVDNARTVDQVFFYSTNYAALQWAQVTTPSFSPVNMSRQPAAPRPHLNYKHGKTPPLLFADRRVIMDINWFGTPGGFCQDQHLHSSMRFGSKGSAHFRLMNERGTHTYDRKYKSHARKWKKKRKIFCFACEKGLCPCTTTLRIRLKTFRKTDITRLFVDDLVAHCWRREQELCNCINHGPPLPFVQIDDLRLNRRCTCCTSLCGQCACAETRVVWGMRKRTGDGSATSGQWRQGVELAYRGHRPASPVGTSKFETATKAEKRSIKAGFPPWLPAIVSLKTLSETGAPSCLPLSNARGNGRKPRSSWCSQGLSGPRLACLFRKKAFALVCNCFFFWPRKVRLVHGCTGLEFKGKSPRSACFGSWRSLGGVLMLRRWKQRI